MFKVQPIDIDFAGWSVVPEGEHNAWGVIFNHNMTLHAVFDIHQQAEANTRAAALNAGGVMQW